MRLEDFEKLANAATPGPWEALTDDRLKTAINCGELHIAMANCGAGLGDEGADANAAFIAACRDMVPKLLKVAGAAKNFLAYREQGSEFILSELLAKALAELEQGEDT